MGVSAELRHQRLSTGQHTCRADCVETRTSGSAAGAGNRPGAPGHRARAYRSDATAIMSNHWRLPISAGQHGGQSFGTPHQCAGCLVGEALAAACSGSPNARGVKAYTLIRGQYDAMGITDKIAEVVLIVLLVIEGRRDRRAAQVPGT